MLVVVIDLSKKFYPRSLRGLRSANVNQQLFAIGGEDFDDKKRDEVLVLALVLVLDDECKKEDEALCETL